MDCYGVHLESAIGLGANAGPFIDLLLAAPGLRSRTIRCQDRKVAVGKAGELLAESLRTFQESWAVDLENGAVGSWAWAMATHLVGSRLNDFDCVAVGAPIDHLEALAPWFSALCQAAHAEYAVLDAKQVVNDLRKHSKGAGLHKGLPGVGWMTWFGPQVLAAAPRLLEGSAWSSVAATPAGVLCRIGDGPSSEVQRVAARASLGSEWFLPDCAGLTFDLTGKNTVTPAWLKRATPPGGTIFKPPKS